MTLKDLKDAVDKMLELAAMEDLDPGQVPVIGLNMHGEYSQVGVHITDRFETSDPDEHFTDDLWGPGEPCVAVQATN